MMTCSAVAPIAPGNTPGSTYAQSLALSPVTSSIRIVRIEWTAANPQLVPITRFYRAEGVAAAGGRQFDPNPLASGFPSSETVARARFVTLSADMKTFTQDPPVTVPGTLVPLATVVQKDNIVWSFPSDCVIAAGSTFYMASASATATTDPSNWDAWSSAVIFYDEFN